MFRVSPAALCLALALACASYPSAAQQRSLGQIAAERAAAPAAAPSAPSAPIAARWKSEQEWIVSDISSAIRNIGAAANGARSSGPVMARAAGGPGAGVTLAITDHLWAPAAFVPMAKAALGPVQLPCAPAGPGILGALLEPTPPQRSGTC